MFKQLGDKKTINRIIEVIKDDNEVVLVKIQSELNQKQIGSTKGDAADLDFIINALKENEIHITEVYYNGIDTFIIKKEEFNSKIKLVCSYISKNTQISFYKKETINIKERSSIFNKLIRIGRNKYD